MDRIQVEKPSPAGHSWSLRFKGLAVSWDVGDKQYCGLVTGPGAICDMQGIPTTGIVQLHPTKSPRHPDGPTTNLSTADLPAAHALWCNRFIPPPAAEGLYRAIQHQEKVAEKGAKTRGFLAEVAPGHEVPVDVKLVLTCNPDDAILDGKGGTIEVNDTHIETFKLKDDDHVIVLVSRRVFNFVRERAVVSGIFDTAAKWEVLMKVDVNLA